jgi:hypothetical protein
MGNKKPITPEQRKAAQKRLAILAGIAVTLLVINFVYQIWHRYAAPAPASTPLTQVKCQLDQHPCSVILPNNRAIELSIEPKPLSVGKPATFSVKLARLAAEKVSFYLLPLGVKDPQRQVLEATEKNGIYQAQTTLPENKLPNQQWMIMVVVKTANETVGVPFKFGAPLK